MGCCIGGGSPTWSPMGGGFSHGIDVVWGGGGLL